MMITVTNDNFVRAESNRMFAGLQAQAGGVNTWKHLRAPAPIDEQTVIRMNRDTLYGMAIADITHGASVTVPDAGGRYLSVMVVNQDHYINRIFTEPGDYALTKDEFDTPYVLLAARILADASDPQDLAQVHKIQDGFSLTAASSEPFVLPGYDEASFTATRQALLAEAATCSTGPPPVRSSARPVVTTGLPSSYPCTEFAASPRRDERCGHTARNWTI
jgi:hypothetical protein